VLAAVEGIRCSLWNTYSSGGPFMQTCAPSHVLASIRCIYTLTHVARNMLQEATSKQQPPACMPQCAAVSSLSLLICQQHHLHRLCSLLWGDTSFPKDRKKVVVARE
jgi:hypothetical protein